MVPVHWPERFAVISKKGLHEKVWAQVQKDFDLEAIPLVLPTTQDLSLDALYQVLYPQVKQLIQENFTAISQLLYRMSISESRVQKYLALYPDDAAHALTYLMVCREAEKVLLRIQFSQGN